MAVLWHERRGHRPAASTASERTPGELLSSDDYESNVERAAKLHPLRQVGGCGLEKGEALQLRSLEAQSGVSFRGADRTAA